MTSHKPLTPPLLKKPEPQAQKRSLPRHEPDDEVFGFSRIRRLPLTIRLKNGDEVAGIVVRHGSYSVMLRDETGRISVHLKNDLAAIFPPPEFTPQEAA
jgi:sRNA-binding regulator protein Hfq